jgi:hypothetical protein
MAESWQPADGAELWCAGMRLAGRRRLFAGERAGLERLARRALGRWILAVAALPAVIALPLLIAGALGARTGDGIATTIGIATFLTWLAGIPILGLTAHDLWRSRARLLRDRARGEVQIFEGRPDPELTPRSRLGRLLVAGTVPWDPASASRLEVLPESRAAAVFKPGKLPALVPVEVVEVAAAPTYALRLPIPEEWRGSEQEPGREFLRRALSAAERSEIETMIRRLRWPGVGTAVAMVLTGLALASLLAGGRARGRDGEGAASLYFTMAMGACVTLAYARGVKIAHGLKRDAEVGIVITTRPEPTAEPEHARASEDEPPATIEFLPFSRLPWNQDGRPASWRRLRRVA